MKFLLALVVALALPATAVAWATEGGSPRRTSASPSVNVQPPYETVWSRRVVDGNAGLLEHGATVGGGRVYGATINGTTFALDAYSGTLLWKRQLARKFATAPAHHRGHLYVNGFQHGHAISRLWKLNAATGRSIWSRKLGRGSEGSPLIVRGKVFVTAGPSGKLLAYRLNGRRAWARRTCRGYQAPTWTGRYIVSADYCGRVRAYTSSGRLAWQRKVAGAVYAGMNSVRGRLYVHTKTGYLYALRAKNGRVVWRRSTGRGVGYPECAATKRRVWCANGWGDNKLTAWNARGRRLWTRRLPGQVMGAVVLTRRMLWVGIHDRIGYHDPKSVQAVQGRHPGTGRLRVSFRGARYDPLAVGRNGMLYVIHYSRVRAIR